MVKEDTITEAPFGFDTRVVAKWCATKSNFNGELAIFVHRVAIVAVVITLCGSVAAYRQLKEDEEIGEPLTNDYAIVDSTIQKQFLR